MGSRMAIYHGGVLQAAWCLWPVVVAVAAVLPVLCLWLCACGHCDLFPLTCVQGVAAGLHAPLTKAQMYRLKELVAEAEEAEGQVIVKLIEQEAGHLVHVPAGWWHWVTNLQV